MQIDGKKTTLDDDAAIYKRRDERSESLSTKEKWKAYHHYQYNGYEINHLLHIKKPYQGLTPQTCHE